MRKTEWYIYEGLLARSYNISSQDHFWRSQERCRRAGEEQTHCMRRTRESLSTWRSTFDLLHASCRRRSSCVSTDLRHISTDPIILTTLALPICMKFFFYTVNRGICCRDCSAFFRPCFQRHGSQAAVIMYNRQHRSLAQLSCLSLADLQLLCFSWGRLLSDLISSLRLRFWGSATIFTLRL